MSETVKPEFGERAVSVYGVGDAMDDFPVLKAFQQYIDAEQAKARKRLLAMGVFFGVFTLAVVAVFVVLLVGASRRNQQLNDRLVDFAMKERSGSAVVVQPQQDTAAVLAFTAKLEEMNRRMAETQAKADKAVAEAEEKARQAVAAAQPKAPSPEELEIQRLRAQLADEKAKAEEEKRQRREEELEAYRRKHYPEFYAAKAEQAARAEQAAKAAKAEPERAAGREAAHEDVDRLIRDLDRILDEADKADAKAKPDGLDALVPIDYLKQPDEKRRGEPKKADKAPVRAKPKAADGVRSVAIGSGDDRMDWEIPE